MAVGEGEYLLLQQGQSKLFLLLRNGTQFHIVTVDKRLTAEAEEKLLNLYPCSDETLREPGINFRELFPKGAAVSGPDAGDTVILYMGKMKQKYVLSDDYSMDQVAAFFDGIEWFQPPKNKRKQDPDAWRLEEQTPALVPVMKRVKQILMVLSILSCGMLVFHPLWSLLGIGVSIGCAVLDIRYPAYFTLLDMSKGSKQKHAVGLGFAASLPILVQALYVLHSFTFITAEIHVWSAAVGILTTLLIGCFAREFRERKRDLFAMVLLLCLFCMGPVGMANYLTDRREPQRETVCIENKYISSGTKSGKKYMLTICLENGTDVRLQVDRGKYEELSVGDEIAIEIRSGGLGIGYLSLPES